jgi:N-acyl homoserine lactone hydrolase
MKDFKLYILDNGRMWGDKSNFIAGCSTATASNLHPEAQWIEFPIQTFLVDHPDGLVLFDTSCHPLGMTERWPDFIRELSPYEVSEDGLLVNRLAQLNVKPSDIKYVVISHLHDDHGGCLELFTNSEIYINDHEFTRTMRQYVLREDLNVHVPKDIEQWIRAGLKWRPVEDDEQEIELMEGVTVLNFGSGHSWGMLGLFLELKNTGNILIASDAIYTAENAGPPIKVPGIIYDSLGYIRTVKKIQRIAKERNATIWFGHDMQQFNGLTKSTDGFYD